MSNSFKDNKQIVSKNVLYPETLFFTLETLKLYMDDVINAISKHPKTAKYFSNSNSNYDVSIIPTVLKNISFKKGNGERVDYMYLTELFNDYITSFKNNYLHSDDERNYFEAKYKSGLVKNFSRIINTSQDSQTSVSRVSGKSYMFFENEVFINILLKLTPEGIPNIIRKYNINEETGKHYTEEDVVAFKNDPENNISYINVTTINMPFTKDKILKEEEYYLYLCHKLSFDSISNGAYFLKNLLFNVNLYISNLYEHLKEFDFESNNIFNHENDIFYKNLDNFYISSESLKYVFLIYKKFFKEDIEKREDLSNRRKRDFLLNLFSDSNRKLFENELNERRLFTYDEENDKYLKLNSKKNEDSDEDSEDEDVEDENLLLFMKGKSFAEYITRNENEDLFFQKCIKDLSHDIPKEGSFYAFRHHSTYSDSDIFINEFLRYIEKMSNKTKVNDIPVLPENSIMNINDGIRLAGSLFHSFNEQSFNESSVPFAQYNTHNLKVENNREITNTNFDIIIQDKFGPESSEYFIKLPEINLGEVEKKWISDTVEDISKKLEAYRLDPEKNASKIDDYEKFLYSIINKDGSQKNFEINFKLPKEENPEDAKIAEKMQYIITNLKIPYNSGKGSELYWTRCFSINNISYIEDFFKKKYFSMFISSGNKLELVVKKEYIQHTPTHGAEELVMNVLYSDEKDAFLASKFLTKKVLDGSPKVFDNSVDTKECLKRYTLSWRKTKSQGEEISGNGVKTRKFFDKEINRAPLIGKFPFIFDTHSVEVNNFFLRESERIKSIVNRFASRSFQPRINTNKGPDFGYDLNPDKSKKSESEDQKLSLSFWNKNSIVGKRSAKTTSILENEREKFNNRNNRGNYQNRGGKGRGGGGRGGGGRGRGRSGGSGRGRGGGGRGGGGRGNYGRSTANRGKNYYKNSGLYDEEIYGYNKRSNYKNTSNLYFKPSSTSSGRGNQSGRGNHNERSQFQIGGRGRGGRDISDRSGGGRGNNSFTETKKSSSKTFTNSFNNSAYSNMYKHLVPDEDDDQKEEKEEEKKEDNHNEDIIDNSKELNNGDDGDDGDFTVFSRRKRTRKLPKLTFNTVSQLGGKQIKLNLETNSSGPSSLSSTPTSFASYELGINGNYPMYINDDEEEEDDNISQNSPQKSIQKSRIKKDEYSDSESDSESDSDDDDIVTPDSDDDDDDIVTPDSDDDDDEDDDIVTPDADADDNDDNIVVADSDSDDDDNIVTPDSDSDDDDNIVVDSDSDDDDN